MINFFVRPWEISDNGDQILRINNTVKHFRDIRQELCESILDEVLYIARASEGAISVEWIMDQPISIRKKYLEQFKEEMKERKERLNKK